MRNFCPRVIWVAANAYPIQSPGWIALFTNWTGPFRRHSVSCRSNSLSSQTPISTLLSNDVRRYAPKYDP